MIERTDKVGGAWHWHTKSELNAAAVAAKLGGEREANDLMLLMRPYVIKMTRAFASDGDFDWGQKDEIKQSAWVGVWKAVPKFNPEAGSKFSTYAHFWMRHEIHEQIAKSSRTLPLSRRAWILSVRLEEMWDEEYPDIDIYDATDEQLAKLEIIDTDNKKKKRTVPQGGALIRAKKGAYAFDPDIDGRQRGVMASAEDDFFEVHSDEDADALSTLDEMAAADDPEAAFSLALDFCDRHGHGVEVANRMMEVQI